MAFLGKMVQRHVSTPKISILKPMFLCSIEMASESFAGPNRGAAFLYVGSMEAESIPIIGRALCRAVAN